MSRDLSRFVLDREQAILVVVDVQERLVPAMPKKVYRKLSQSIDMLIKAAVELGVPIITTEQYPRGLGHTVSGLDSACKTTVIEKVSFGCCGEQAFLEALKQSGRTQVILTGMEAHVCVYQTVLGLLESGYHVHLVSDAICSRNKNDYLAGVDNARCAGAVVTTTEMALFQMLKEAGTTEFKVVSGLVKNRDNG